jgi:hypothetical protein
MDYFVVVEVPRETAQILNKSLAQEEVRQAENLIRYAVVTRYPGLAEPVTETHYQGTVANAEAVISWTKKMRLM